MSISFEKHLLKKLNTKGGFDDILELMKKVAELGKYDEKLRIKETVVVYPKQMRTKYFRGDDFLSFVSTFPKKIEGLFKEYELDLSNPENIKAFLNTLVTQKFLIRFDRTPDDENKKGKKKWPKKVVASQKPTFAEKSFFFWTFKDKPRSFWAFLIVSFIIGLLLFPIWPMKLKVGTFYFSLYTLIFLIGFILVRLLLYMLLRIFGVEFWILPEVFESDSFVPVVSFTRSDDDMFGWIFRILLLALFGWFSYSIYTDPGTIQGVASASTQSFDDIITWGRLKIGADGQKNKKKYASFAEEILLAEKAMEEEEDEEEAPSPTEAPEGEENKEEDFETVDQEEQTTNNSNDSDL